MTISKLQPSLQPSVLWMPTAGLAAVQGAFTLSWVIYVVQLPTLLEKTRLTAAFTPTMLLIDALLAIAIEPIMGLFADRLAAAPRAVAQSDRLEKTNRRFHLIWVGIALSAVLFVILALLHQAGQGEWVPGLLIVWAIAMSIFRVPAIALLRQYAQPLNLPQAASLLTLAAGLAGVTRPWATPFIKQLGVPVTFILCAIALIVATAALSASHPSSLPAAPRSASPDLPARLGLIAIVGVCVTLAFRLAIETLPKILKAVLPQVQPPTIVGWTFIAIALTAIPAGLLAKRIGNRRTMAIGLIAMGIGLGLMPLIGSVQMAIGLALALGAAFSLVSNGTLPFALSLIPPGAAGLSVGAFFGGAAIATSLFFALSIHFAVPSFAVTAGVLAIVLAAICVALAHRLEQRELR